MSKQYLFCYSRDNFPKSNIYPFLVKAWQHSLLRDSVANFHINTSIFSSLNAGVLYQSRYGTSLTAKHDVRTMLL